MNFYKRFPADYLIDTIGLSLIEDGIYTRLLDYQYKNERKIFDEKDAINICRASTKEERESAEKIFHRFFRYGWNPRARYEIENATRIAEAAREHGKLGGRRKKEQILETTVVALQTPDSRLLDYKKEEREKLLPIPAKNAYIGEFPRFWLQYPRKDGKAQAQKAWIKHKCDPHIEIILANLEAWKQTAQWSDPQFIPYASSWINKRFCEESPVPALTMQAGSFTTQIKAIEQKYGI